MIRTLVPVTSFPRQLHMSKLHTHTGLIQIEYPGGLVITPRVYRKEFFPYDGSAASSI